MKSEIYVKSILHDIRRVVDDIKSIKIQGATNVAKEAFKVLKKGIEDYALDKENDFETFLKNAIKMLMEARPTEPMLFNGMKYVLSTYSNLKNVSNFDDLIISLSKSLDELLDMIATGDQQRSKVGAGLIKDGYNVLTHCHSGSVVKVIQEAWSQGTKFNMFNTETRPLYQGRTTSKNFLKIGVPTTMITDNMAPYFIDNTVEHDIDIDMIILGCDAIKKDGSIINKVGSFAIALSAYYSKIPVYVVGSLTKFDYDDVIHIETRNGNEIRSDAPKGLNIINYAFDTIPAKFVTGIIARSGVVTPDSVKYIVHDNYPWMEYKI